MIKIVIYSLFNENKALLALENEFIKRAQKDIKFELVKVRSEDKIISAIKKNKNSYFIALDENGENLSSEDFASFINKNLISGVSSFSFVIGEASGLNKKLITSCKKIISLSKLTFTSAQARYILIEQIYRANSIICNHPYHKS